MTTRCARSLSAPCCPTRGRRKMHGRRPSAAATPKSEERFAATIDATGVDDSGDTLALSAVCAAYRATRTTDTTFAPVKASEKDRNPLAAQLAMVIKAVRAGVSSRVYMVQLGGFDTRADERETQQRLLQLLR